MFFLRIAEALIANQEASILSEENTSRRCNNADFWSSCEDGKRNEVLFGSRLRRLIDAPPIVTSASSPLEERRLQAQYTTAISSGDSAIVSPAPRSETSTHCGLTVMSVSTSEGLRSRSTSLSSTSSASSTPSQRPTNMVAGKHNGGLLYNLLISKSTESAGPSKRSDLICREGEFTSTRCLLKQSTSLRRNGTSTGPSSPMDTNSNSPILGAVAKEAETLADRRIDEHFSRSKKFLDDLDYPIKSKKYRVSLEQTTPISTILGTRLSSTPSSLGEVRRPGTNPPRRSSFGECYGRFRRLNGGRLAAALMSTDRGSTYHSSCLMNSESAGSSQVIGKPPPTGMPKVAGVGLSRNSPQASLHVSSSTPSILSALIACSRAESSPGMSSASTDSGLDEPLDLTGCHPLPSVREKIDQEPQKLEDHVACQEAASCDCAPYSPPVQLAKKITKPVQARVTEWLRQASEFVAIADASEVMVAAPQADASPNGRSSWSDGDSRLDLLGLIWHRLLVLSMAEHALDVVIVESKRDIHEASVATAGKGLRKKTLFPWLAAAGANGCLQPEHRCSSAPDKNFADRLLLCVSELQEPNLTREEFRLLRYAVLLTAEKPQTLPLLGTNLMKATRHRELSTYPYPTASFELDAQATENTNSGTEALYRGLGLLICLCPTKMALLFCAHLHEESVVADQLLAEVRRLLSLKSARPPTVPEANPVEEPASHSSDPAAAASGILSVNPANGHRLSVRTFPSGSFATSLHSAPDVTGNEPPTGISIS